MPKCHTIFLTVVLLYALGACASWAAQPDDVMGKWLITNERSIVEIFKENGTYCGKIVDLKEPLDPDTGKPKLDKFNVDPARHQDPLIGMKLVWGFAHKGGDVWTGGRIYDPENGKTYYCRMTLRGAQLTVRGSLDRWGIAGRTVVWTRK